MVQDNKQNKPDDHQVQLWTTLQLAVVAAILVSPSFLLANDLTDGDEVVKTGAGVAAAAIVAQIWKVLKA